MSSEINGLIDTIMSHSTAHNIKAAEETIWSQRAERIALAVQTQTREAYRGFREKLCAEIKIIDSSTNKELQQVRKRLEQEHQKSADKPQLFTEESTLFSQLLRDDKSMLGEFRDIEGEGSAKASGSDHGASQGQNEEQHEPMSASMQEKSDGSGTKNNTRKFNSEPTRKALFGTCGLPGSPSKTNHKFRDIRYQHTKRSSKRCSPKRPSPKRLNLQHHIRRSKTSTPSRPLAARKSTPSTKPYATSKFQLREDGDGDGDKDDDGYDGYETDVSPIRRRRLRLRSFLSASQPSPDRTGRKGRNSTKNIVKASIESKGDNATYDENANGTNATTLSSGPSSPGASTPSPAPSTAPATTKPEGIRRRSLRASTPVPTYNTEKVFDRLVGSLNGPEYKLAPKQKQKKDGDGSDGSIIVSDDFDSAVDNILNRRRGRSRLEELRGTL